MFSSNRWLVNPMAVLLLSSLALVIAGNLMGALYAAIFAIAWFFVWVTGAITMQERRAREDNGDE